MADDDLPLLFLGVNLIIENRSKRVGGGYWGRGR
jgi:hypothetical protein